MIKKYHVSKNLFDELYPDVTTTIVYKAINVGNGRFTLSTNAPLVNNGALLFMLAGDVTTGASTSNNGVSESVSRTVTAVNGYITIAYIIRGGKSPADYEVMLNTGSQPLPYEPYGNTWKEIPYRKYDTSTDTLTTLPADLYADGNNATVGLVGNMEQSGTPTPQNPIQPSECGERTGNLVDYTQSETGGIDNSGNLVPATNLWRSTVYTAIDATLQYFVSWISNTNLNAVRINYYTSDKTHISREQLYNSGTALTIPQNAAFFKWTLYAQSDFVVDLSFVQSLQLMIGSTAIPFEPYGYKIPISSANTTTPVYLGEVQSTRQIKKLVLDGTERLSVGYNSGNVYRYGLSDLANLGAPQAIILSSHFSWGGYTATTGSIGEVTSNSTTTFRCWLWSALTTEADFRQWLSAQYAAGTPVTVWYVLEEPTTGIVNEPLRKIGDYADTVSGITIPTITGKDTFDVETTLKPSEVSLSYTGWHDATVKEWDGSEW